jgi:MoaA/NifB/PqqE/SkfB family radical SAM enzyme
MYKPKKLSLIITNVCNSTCKYCLYDKKTNYLPLEDIKKVVKSAKQLGIETVTITGGEPSLHPHFFEILDYVTSLNLPVGLISNGFNMDKKKVQRILNYGSVQLWTSLDSHIPQINDFQRGKNSFRNATNFIRIIRQINPNQYIGAVSIITKNTIHSYNKTANFLLNELNINEIRIDRPTILKKAEENKLSNTEITKDFIKLSAKLQEKYNGKIHPIVGCYGSECPIFNTEYFEINIFPDGRIIPCCFLHDPIFNMGTIKDNLSSVLSNNNINKYRELIKNFYQNQKSYLESTGIFTCVECVEEYKKIKNSGELNRIINSKKKKKFIDIIRKFVT